MTVNLTSDIFLKLLNTWDTDTTFPRPFSQMHFEKIGYYVLNLNHTTMQSICQVQLGPGASREPNGNDHGGILQFIYSNFRDIVPNWHCKVKEALGLLQITVFKKMT